MNRSAESIPPDISKRPLDPAITGRKELMRRLEALATVKRYRRGQEIWSQQSSGDHWYRMITGVARKCAIRTDGRRQIVDLLLPGDCFGFTTRETHCFAAEAVVDDTAVACYPRRRAEELADSDPEVARVIREMAFEAITRLQEQVMILGRATALQRVGAFLLCMAGRSGRGTADRLDLPVSRYDIADYLALSSETVSRSLTGLKYRGAIEFAGTRRLSIVDRGALEEDEGHSSVAAAR